MVRVLLEKVTKVFEPDVIAVKDVTLEIPDKKIICLLGPSGCGKTTTMRMIAGLESPTSGKIYFGDSDVTNMPVKDRDVGMIFQFPIVYPDSTVFQNIALPLEAIKLPKDEVKARVREVADLLDLSHVLGIKSGRLDMGMKQRVSLARCIAKKRNIYLFDEPLTNLDSIARVQLRGELKKLQIELGETIVFVTHDQGEALTMGEKIVVMNAGEILQYDTPENIYASPASSFVAWFIGNPGMNLIDCSLREIDGKAFLESEGIRHNVTQVIDIIKTHSSSGQLLLGIRPEDVVVSREKHGGSMASECIMTELLGNMMLLHLSVGQQTIKAKTTLLEIQEGDKVYFSLPVERVKVFDKKTEQLIV